MRAVSRAVSVFLPLVATPTPQPSPSGNIVEVVWRTKQVEIVLSVITLILVGVFLRQIAEAVSRGGGKLARWLAVQQRPQVGDPVPLLGAERDLALLDVDVALGHESQWEEEDDGDQDDLLRVAQPSEHAARGHEQSRHYRWPFRGRRSVDRRGWLLLPGLLSVRTREN